MRIPFAALFALAACFCVAADEKKPDPEPAPKVVAPPKADIRGKVTTAAALSGRGIGSLLVEGAKEKDTQYDKASILLTNKTTFHTWQGGKKVAAKFEDVKAGMSVQCTFDGPVDLSLPVGAVAADVLILPAAKPRPGR